MHMSVRRWPLRLGVGVGGAGGTLYWADQQNAHVLSRSARVFMTGAQVLIDYRRHLKPIERDEPTYKQSLKEFNERTAQRLLDLFYENGGVYTKLGQQLATFNHALPREYTGTLAKLQDQAQPVSFDDVARAIQTAFERPWQELFREINEQPIAAASLAQVHHAVDHNGREVAVKVQYPHLQQQMHLDIRVVRLALWFIEYYFPDVQVQWIYPEYERALRSELDFSNEKRNSRRIAHCLRHNPAVHVPTVYDELTSSKVLTMEFIHAPKISDIDGIKALNLNPNNVAQQLCDIFSEMIFLHAFVHCDPHAGNLFVRENPDPKAASREQIVLLDHGLYRELDGDFRRTYCDLWRAMLLHDSALLEDCGHRLNVGAFARFLPLLFTFRRANTSSWGPIDAKMNEQDRKELGDELKKLQFSDVTDFLQQLPRDMLFVFRTNNMIRSLNKELGGTTRDRFMSMGKFAAKGHAAFYGSSTEGSLSWTSSIIYWIEHTRLLFHLKALDWVFQVVEYVRGGHPVIRHTAG